MSPDERELGKLIATVEALGKSIEEMKRANADDHKEVVRALDEMRKEMAKKASEEWVREVEGRTDKLESRADKIAAIVGLAVVASAAVPGFLSLITGGHS